MRNTNSALKYEQKNQQLQWNILLLCLWCCNRGEMVFVLVWLRVYIAQCFHESLWPSTVLPSTNLQCSFPISACIKNTWDINRDVRDINKDIWGQTRKRKNVTGPGGICVVLPDYSRAAILETFLQTWGSSTISTGTVLQCSSSPHQAQKLVGHARLELHNYRGVYQEVSSSWFTMVHTDRLGSGLRW